MPVVAVLNPKGGSGKSTVAAHLATAWAREGHKVMLGDVDRQQSVKSWLKRRSEREASILTWVVDQRNVFRAPTGVTHVVLDTPGALYGHDLARVVMWLDAVVVPVGPSIFDRDASMAFLRQLLALPRVRSGRCRVCMVGMRWSARDLDAAPRRLGEHPDLSLLCVIPEERSYRESLEQGVTVFDGAASEPRLLDPWRPLLDWLNQTPSEPARHVQGGSRPAAAGRVSETAQAGRVAWGAPAAAAVVPKPAAPSWLLRADDAQAASAAAAVTATTPAPAMAQMDAVTRPGVADKQAAAAGPTATGDGALHAGSPALERPAVNEALTPPAPAAEPVAPPRERATSWVSRWLSARG